MKTNKYYIIRGEMEEIEETIEERLEMLEEEVRYLIDKVKSLDDDNEEAEQNYYYRDSKGC